MSVYKRYNGKRVSSSHPDYSKSRWWIYKRLKGKIIHQGLPEAKTKQEAELAERQILKASLIVVIMLQQFQTQTILDLRLPRLGNFRRFGKIRLSLDRLSDTASIRPRDCRNCRQNNLGDTLKIKNHKTKFQITRGR